MVLHDASQSPHVIEPCSIKYRRPGHVTGAPHARGSGPAPAAPFPDCGLAAFRRLDAARGSRHPPDVCGGPAYSRPCRANARRAPARGAHAATRGWRRLGWRNARRAAAGDASDAGIPALLPPGVPATLPVTFAGVPGASAATALLHPLDHPITPPSPRRHPTLFSFFSAARTQFQLFAGHTTISKYCRLLSLRRHSANWAVWWLLTLLLLLAD